MNTAKLLTDGRLFADKRALTALCAIIILISMPVSLFASYRLDNGYMLILPSFATVLAGTLLQELVAGRAGKGTQILISALKYSVAAIWAVCCIFPVAEELSERVEAGLYTGNAPISYITEFGFGFIAVCFAVALVLEICVIMRDGKAAKNNFLFIDNVKFIAIYAAVFISGFIVLKLIYNGHSISDAGSYPLLCVVPSLIVIFGVTAVQEIVYRFCRNRVLHIVFSAVKWSLAVLWFIFANFILIFCSIFGFIMYVAVVALWVYFAMSEINLLINKLKLPE